MYCEHSFITLYGAQFVWHKTQKKNRIHIVQNSKFHYTYDLPMHKKKLPLDEYIPLDGVIKAQKEGFHRIHNVYAVFVVQF